MPIYEYRCADCYQVFEEWCKNPNDGDEPRKCPACGAKAERIMSNTSFTLKGGGWYVTDYGTHKGKSEGGPKPTGGASSSDSSAVSSSASSSPATS